MSAFTSGPKGNATPHGAARTAALALALTGSLTLCWGLSGCDILGSEVLSNDGSSPVATTTNAPSPGDASDAANAPGEPDTVSTPVTSETNAGGQESGATSGATSSSHNGADASVMFDGLAITLKTKPDFWQWSQVTSTASSHNGMLVVGIPASATNTADTSRLLAGTSCTIMGPSGERLDDISSELPRSILVGGSIEQGATRSGVLHILYAGPGTYTIKFDNHLGKSAEASIEIGSSRDIGLRAIPESLSQANRASALPAGTPFTAEGLTITLSPDPDAYIWTTLSNTGDPGWDGRVCVGVPVTVTNNSPEPHTLAENTYAKFEPNGLYLGDPARKLAYGNSDADIATLGAIAPGQTLQARMYFAYDIAGIYYLAMDNDGMMVIAGVQLG